MTTQRWSPLESATVGTDGTGALAPRTEPRIKPRIESLAEPGIPPVIQPGIEPGIERGISTGLDPVLEHLASLAPAVTSLQRQARRLADWGTELAARLMDGQRLLAAGNGGSAAEAQHLTAELVGRFDSERRAFSAIALHADTSAVTAIGNDYGFDQLFARQVEGHARPGDVLVLMSTSGRSANLLNAAAAARSAGVTTWALTGPAPNPLAFACDDYVAIDAPSANVQEAHLIGLHAICRAFDAEVARRCPEGKHPADRKEYR